MVPQAMVCQLCAETIGLSGQFVEVAASVFVYDAEQKELGAWGRKAVRQVLILRHTAAMSSCFIRYKQL